MTNRQCVHFSGGAFQSYHFPSPMWLSIIIWRVQPRGSMSNEYGKSNSLYQIWVPMSSWSNFVDLHGDLGLGPCQPPCWHPMQGQLNTITIPMSTSCFFVLMNQVLQIDKNAHFFYLRTFLSKPLDILWQVFVRLLPSLISPLDIIQGDVGSTANGLVGLGEWWLLTLKNICKPGT